jgi:hypothetical protein
VLTSEAILSLLFTRARRFACRRNTLIHHRLCRMRAARGGWIIRRNMRARSSRCDVLIPETVTARMPVCAWRRCFTKSCDRLQNHQPHSSRSPPPKSYRQHVQHQAQRQCACYMRGTPRPRNLHPVSRTWLKPIEDQTKATRPCSTGFPVCWRKAIIQHLERLFYDDDICESEMSQERQILPTLFES